MTDDPNAEQGGPETDAWAGLGQAWRAREGEPLPPTDTAEIARRARRFAGTIRLRNGGDWLACLALTAFGAVGVAREASWLGKLSGLVLVGVSLWVGGTLFVRGRNLVAPSPAATTAEVLAYERAQLARQRALLLGVRRWYLGPLMGWIIMSVAVRVVEVYPRGGQALRLTLIASAVTLVMAAVVCVVVDRLNARAARELEKKLSQLG